MDACFELMEVIDDFILSRTNTDVASGIREEIMFINKHALTKYIKSNYVLKRITEHTTKCAMCGVVKETPLRRDELGGYVCLACVDKHLDLLELKQGTCKWVRIGKQNYTTQCGKEVIGWSENDNGEIDFCDSCGGEIKIV